MGWKRWVYEFYQQVPYSPYQFPGPCQTNPNFIVVLATNMSWNNKFHWFFFNPNRKIIYQVIIFIFATLFHSYFISASGINWWKLLVPGTVDAFSNLLVRLLLTSSFSTWRNLIPSIADLQYSNINSVERICLVVDLWRLSFDTILFTVPPLPSHGWSLETFFWHYPFHCPTFAITRLVFGDFLLTLSFSLSHLCHHTVGLWRLSFDTILFTVPPLPSHSCLPWLVAKKFHFVLNPKSFWWWHKLAKFL